MMMTRIAAEKGLPLSRSSPMPRRLRRYADLIKEAAALWEGLAQNHPFIDGNKRTAFAAVYTFLAINGGRITAEGPHGLKPARSGR